MSISAAMNPRGTVVLEQVNDLSVHDTEVERMYRHDRVARLMLIPCSN
jgi:hypothetical protein